MLGIDPAGRAALVLAATIALIGSAAALPAATAQNQEIGDTTVFTTVGQPGSPEGIYVDGDRVFVGTHTPVYGNSDQGPSHIFVYDKATGDKIGDITVEGQKTNDTHGLLGMAMDHSGRLYVIDRNPARLLRFTLAEEPDGTVVATQQETYATFENLPACPPGPLPGPALQCSPNTIDQAPFPDYVAFTPDGDAYVTDLEQAVIWRVPSGGMPADENAEVWYADERFDSIFATNGIALNASQDRLYFAMTGHMFPAETAGGALAAPTQGAIYSLPAQDAAPAPEDLEAFHVYTDPAVGPDGIAFGTSGNLYVALAGSSQVSVLWPSGEELHRFPDPATNQLREIPYDMPGSLAFDDEDASILVTNHAFFTGNPNHWAVLEAYVDDTGLPLVEPTVDS